MVPKVCKAQPLLGGWFCPACVWGSLPQISQTRTWWTCRWPSCLNEGSIFGTSPMLPFSSTLTRLAPVGEKVMFFIMKSPLSCFSLLLPLLLILKTCLHFLQLWLSHGTYSFSSSTAPQKSSWHLSASDFPASNGWERELTPQLTKIHFCFHYISLLFLCWMPRVMWLCLHCCPYCASSSPGNLSALSSMVSSHRLSAEHP